MSDNLSDLLASCLEAIERGEYTVEECLALYPEHRAGLEPLLQTAAIVWERADFSARPSFRLSSRARLLSRLRPHQTGFFRGSTPQTRNKPYPLFSKRHAMLWMSIFVLAVSLIGGGSVYAFNEALPGDTLYPLKLSIEDAHLLIANDYDDVPLAVEFVQTRVEEIQALLQADRGEDLSLAVDQLSDSITIATESLTKIARQDPEHAAELSSLLAQALALHTEVLTSNLDTVPEQAKPAIERAILASNRGQEDVQNLLNLLEEGLPGNGSPPEGVVPSLAPTPHGDGPPDGVPTGGGPAPTPHGNGPPDGVLTPPRGSPDGAGPPTKVPGGKP